MKIDYRETRDYNLRENSGDYKSKDDLRVWMRFPTRERLPGNDKQVANLDTRIQVNGKLTVGFGGSEIVVAIKDKLLVGESNLQGRNATSRGSVVIPKNSRFKINMLSASPAVADSDEEFSISIWFRVINNWPMTSPNERDVQLIQITTPSRSRAWEMTYDPNGSGAGVAGITVQAWNSPGTVASTGVFRLDNPATIPPAPGNPGYHLVGWHHLAFTAKNTAHAVGKAATDPSDWTMMFDGRELLLATSTTHPAVSAESFKEISVGSYSAALAGTYSAMILPEVAYWGKKVPKKAWKGLYMKGISSADSGFVSLPPLSPCRETVCGKDAYPTIAKSTDQYRLNRETPYYDDAQTTIDFGPIKTGSLNYPTLLRSGSRYVTKVLATPNQLPDIFVRHAIAGSTEIQLGPSVPTVGTTARLMSTDGTERLYTAAAALSLPDNEFNASSTDLVAIATLRECVESSYGHDGKILTTMGNRTIILSQSLEPGLTSGRPAERGNTPVVSTFDNSALTMGITDFSGGTSGPLGPIFSVASSVVGDYPADARESFASSYHPFDDSFLAVNIAEKPAYLPAFAPGFTKTQGDRVVIEIDITPGSPHYMSVRTGSDGDTFRNTGPGAKTSPIHTGMSYFNFSLNEWEGIGGMVPRHTAGGEPRQGKHLNWNIPCEITGGGAGSAGDPGSSKPRRNNSSPFARSPQTWAAAPDATLLNTVRLFQPFSSLAASRSTFNFIYDWDYISLPGQGTGCAYDAVDYNGDPVVYEPAIEMSEKWRAAYTGPSGGGTNTIYNTRYQHDLINIFASDALGLTKVFSGLSASHDVRYPKVWNVDDGGSGSVWHDAINHQLKGIGLPIAYSAFSHSPRFYASASQLLNVGDYIDTPMLLEAVEVVTDATAQRLFYTTVETGRGGRGTTDPGNSVSAWSTTNNAVDCLTFFLLRQQDNFRGKCNTIDQAADSTRELITWSNNIFYSPYVGWDFWQSWSHPYYAGGPDELWPNPTAMAGWKPSSAYYPGCGRRFSRRFEITSSSLQQNVEACDNTFPYMSASATGPQSLTQDGLSGVFIGAANPTEALTGVPDLDDIHPDLMPVTERWMTSSVHMESTFPVRVCGQYAHHDQPILPGDVFCSSGDAFNTNGGGTYVANVASSSNIMPIANDWNEMLLSNPGNRPRFYECGWDWIGRLYPNRTAATWSASQPSGPREFAGCYGRYWQGGNQTSRETPLPFDDGFSMPADLGTRKPLKPIGAPILRMPDHPAPIFSYPETTIAAGREPATPRLFHVGPTSRLNSILPLSASARVGSVVPAQGAAFPGANTEAQYAVNGPFRYSTGRGFVGYSPNYTRYDISGSLVYNSAQILLPEDQLVLGAQWSPGDPVHQNYTSISASLARAGCRYDADPYNDVTNHNTGANCEFNTAFLYAHRTNWGEKDDIVGSLLQKTAVPIEGWCLSATDVGNAHAGYAPMEWQYRFLGWDESNDLKVYASASLRIETKPSKLRLYGVLLRDQKQFHQPLSQQTKTVCVHEALSNGPVLDQFYVPTARDLHGSSLARIISGSIGARWPNGSPRDGGPGLVTSQARRAGDFGYGIASNIATRRVIRSMWGSIPDKPASLLFDVGSIKRFTNHVDVSEVYYDSMTPNIEGLWAADNRKLLNINEAGDFTRVPIAAWAYVPRDQAWRSALDSTQRCNTIYWGGDEERQPPNEYWPLAFPFEPRYEGVGRVLKERSLKVAGYIDQNPDQFALLYPGGPSAGGSTPPVARGSWGRTSGFSWSTSRYAQPIWGLSTGSLSGLSTPNTLRPTYINQPFSTMWYERNPADPGLASDEPMPYVSARGCAALDPWDVRNSMLGSTWLLARKELGNISDGGLGFLPYTKSPRYGCFAPTSTRNAGYVFYPSYPVVQNRFIEKDPIRFKAMTNGLWQPGIQFNRQSGSMGEKCIKNHIFGVGRLMFAPEPIHVVLSSSKDSVQNNYDMFLKWAGATGTGVPSLPPVGQTVSIKHSYYNAWGNASAFNFFCGKPRGWRYGLLNAFPTHTSCVFRRQQYGQFRDMLEQRQYSALYVDDPADVAVSRRAAGLRVRKRQIPRRTAIHATFRYPTFIDPTSTSFQLTPAETQCSNLSVYATSSLPYFDGVVKNRDEVPLPDETSVDVERSLP